MNRPQLPPYMRNQFDELEAAIKMGEEYLQRDTLTAWDRASTTRDVVKCRTLLDAIREQYDVDDASSPVKASATIFA